MIKTESTTSKLYSYDTTSEAVASSEKNNKGIFEEAKSAKGQELQSVSFFSEDWSASVARKLGMNDFADWIDNKEAEENPEKAKKEGIISKSLRAMVKHPVITALSIATVIVGGRALYKYVQNPSNFPLAGPVNTKQVAPTSQVMTEVAKKTPKLECTPENMKILRERVASGIEYQRSINYADFEALKNMPEEKRKSLLNFLEFYPEKGSELLAFLAGEKPALLEGTTCYSINTFMGLRTDDLIVSSFFRDEKGCFLMNKKSVSKILSTNKEFFQQRLGLPVNCTLEDIERLIYRSSGSPLKEEGVYEDLIQLILGQNKYNAYHAQIVKDIKAKSLVFHPCYIKDVDEYRTLLKDTIAKQSSTYYGMSQGFKDDLIKNIDRLPAESLKNFVHDYINVFKSPNAEKEEFEFLQRLAKKLEDAQLHGKPIKFV